MVKDCVTRCFDHIELAVYVIDKNLVVVIVAFFFVLFIFVLCFQFPASICKRLYLVLHEAYLVPSFFLYSSWLAILILLAYMAMVIVILLNVLIAQLSYTYSEAKTNAKLQYAIDRMRIVTRLEHSRFARFVSAPEFLSIFNCFQLLFFFSYYLCLNMCSCRSFVNLTL